MRLIAATKHLPAASCATVPEHLLEELDGVPLVSPQEIEAKIRIAANAVVQVAVWCEESLCDTSYSTHCSLRSHQANEMGRDQFNVPQPKGTLWRYCQSWKQFLDFCLRVWCLEPSIREWVYGFQFSHGQEDLMDEVLDHITENMDQLMGADAAEDNESDRAKAARKAGANT